MKLAPRVAGFLVARCLAVLFFASATCNGLKVVLYPLWVDPWGLQAPLNFIFGPLIKTIVLFVVGAVLWRSAHRFGETVLKESDTVLAPPTTMLRMILLCVAIVVAFGIGPVTGGLPQVTDHALITPTPMYQPGRPAQSTSPLRGIALGAILLLGKLDPGNGRSIAMIVAYPRLESDEE